MSTTKPTIAMVHGAFAESSSWHPVIEHLTHHGTQGDAAPAPPFRDVIAVGNPLRSVAGDAAISHGFEELRTSVLRKKREDAGLRAEIIEMRQKMLAAHPNTSGLFDLKHDPGGIIDVEFMVQYLVLGHAHDHPELTANAGNLALLKAAATLGLIGGAEAESVRAAYRRFRKLQHQLRLAGERYARVEPATIADAAAAVRALWTALFGDAGKRAP